MTKFSVNSKTFVKEYLTHKIVQPLQKTMNCKIFEWSFCRDQISSYECTYSTFSKRSTTSSTLTEAYLGPNQATMMECFSKNNQLNYFPRNHDVRQGP